MDRSVAKALQFIPFACTTLACLAGCHSTGPKFAADSQILKNSIASSQNESISESNANHINESPSVQVETPTHQLVSHTTVSQDQPSILAVATDTTSTVGNTGNITAGMSLQDFEALALNNNPTIQQLTAIVNKAAGYRQQVSLLPNPVIGYQGMQLADRGTDQHTAFVEQEIVTGDKLAWNRQVLNQAVRAQLFELEAQRIRVRTDVQLRFYAALEAQKRLQIAEEFEKVTSKGLELAELRKKALEGSQVEVLQAKVQLNQVQLAKQQAEVSLAAAWRGLVAVVGCPNLSQSQLVGELPQDSNSIDWANIHQSLLVASPEYQAAQARVQQARAFLQRQGIQTIPNLLTQFATGYDNGTDSEMINVQVGAPIPLFNKNQGNLAAARADYCRAVLDVQRIENSILSRLATVSGEYDAASAAVQKYQKEILPSVQETLDLAEKAYQAGEFSFLEVLIVRRTYFESNLQFVAALAQAAQAKAKVDGYVLSGSLDSVIDQSGDSSLRDQTFSQQ